MAESNSIPPQKEIQYGRIDPSINNLVRALGIESKNPIDDDLVVRAFCEAAIETIFDGQLLPTLHSTLEMRSRMEKRKLRAPDLAALLFRAFHKQAYRYEDDYPSPVHTEYETWLRIIERTLSEHSRTEELELDLLRDVQSNVADRAVGPELVLHSEHDRLGDNPTVLEVGTSDGQLLHLMSPEIDVPFNPVNVVHSLGRHATKGFFDERRTLQNETEYINGLLQDKHPFQGVGLDQVRRDEKTSLWVFANTIRPREMALDPSRAERFERLHATEASNVQFYTGSFSEEGVKNLASSTGIEKFDFIVFPTILYQQDSATIASMRGLARKLLSPHGLIGYQDKIHTNPRNRAEMKFFPRFDHYNLLLEDPLMSGDLLYQVLEFDSGRCREVKFGPNAAKLSLYKRMKRRTKQSRG